MKRIHVARNRQPLGHFSPEEVSTGLRSGRFTPSDLAWCEPMESWKPLSEFPELQPAEAPPAPLPSQDWPPVQAEPVLAIPAGVEPAWERRQELGFFPALVATAKSVFSTPLLVFKNLKIEGGVANPALYFFLLATLTGWVSMVYQFSLTLVNPAMALNASGQNFTTAQLVVGFIFACFMIPVIFAIFPFVASGVLHGVLMLLGGASKPYEATFRVFCYAWGTVVLFQLIPLCGGYVTMAWGAALLAIGLKEVHGTDYVKSITAVFVPMILCCGAIFSMVAGMGAMTTLLK